MRKTIRRSSGRPALRSTMAFCTSALSNTICEMEMRETGKSKTCVWRWQERFAAEGVDGLLVDNLSRIGSTRTATIQHRSARWRSGGHAEKEDPCPKTVD